MPISKPKLDDDYMTIPSSPMDLGKLQSSITKIKDLVDLENLDFQNDKLAFNAQRVLLASLLAVYPTAVETYLSKPGQSSMYSLTNLTTQINELFNEIRTSQSLENQLEHISENIIDPMVKGLISGLFDTVYEQKQKLKLLDSSEEIKRTIESIFNELLKKYAVLMNQKKEEAVDKLSNYLLEV